MWRACPVLGMHLLFLLLGHPFLRYHYFLSFTQRPPLWALGSPHCPAQNFSPVPCPPKQPTPRPHLIADILTHGAILTALMAPGKWPSCADGLCPAPCNFIGPSPFDYGLGHVAALSSETRTDALKKRLEEALAASPSLSPQPSRTVRGNLGRPTGEQTTAAG